ncbi:carbohydrate ABC transporter substrate-binding protein [Paenibacillus sp. 1011MAR3C5]|uniref:ABC transporter substrate-binding protein n=1 Tax=Paenibacillus sp. 1011MAR3C5 TaxID=1675787 RepID=UPI000E6C597B|nr:ABC transporter substrate-binding protein [Paenibacillus sp. 1011MAR3C5]RJE90890.1 carbohydrate ABC transporter substrate-binding protein [Paenibacillus sp. 1011MAR3C5]
MRKRTDCWLSVILIAALLLQGCSTLGVGKKEKQNITLKVMGQTDVITRFKPMLEEKFPHISYEIIDPMITLNAEKIPVDGWDDRIATIIEEEDVDLYLNYYPESYIEDFPLVDMAPLLTRDRIIRNDIQQILVDSAKGTDGRLLQLSPTFNRDVLFINRKLFRELGVPEPRSPMTWEQFRQSALALQEKDATVHGYILNMPWMLPFYWVAENIMGWKQIENRQLRITEPEWRQLFEQLYEDMMKASFQNLGDSPDRDPQQAGMYLAPASYVQQMIYEQRTSEDWTITELPRDPSHTQMTPFEATNNFAIHGDSSYSEDAWGVVSYLMSEEAAVRIMEERIAYGFVAYPNLISIGDFPIEPIVTANGTPWSPSDESLTEEAYRSLTDTFNGNFEAAAIGLVTFDTAWANAEKKVQELNADPGSFEQ